MKKNLGLTIQIFHHYNKESTIKHITLPKKWGQIVKSITS